MTVTAAALRQLADSLADASEPLVITSPSLVVPSAVVASMADDATTSTAVLAVRSRDGDLRVRHHRLHSAGSDHHDVSDPDHQAVGVLVISVADAVEARVALARMAEVADERGWDDDVVALATVALVRSGVIVTTRLMPDLPWGHATNAEESQRLHDEVNGIDAQRIARLLANRPDDGLYSTFVLRRLSKPVTAWAIRAGVTPNTITVSSLIIGLVAAAAFALGTWPWLVVGALLLQVSIVVDCCDGEVARATRAYSSVGAWLDASTDRIKEYAAYAGLAIGASAVTGASLWPVALILIVVQTFRHMCDYDFSRVQRLREGHVPVRDLADPLDGGSGDSAWAARSSRMNQDRRVMWAKKVAHMPIGERWLVLSAGAVIGGAALALWGLLVLVLLALAYVTAGRLLRTRSWRGPAHPASTLMLERQLDLVFVSFAVRGALQSPIGWLVPALLRLIELGIVAVLCIVVAPLAIVAGFWWCFVVAFHHYDALYRALQDRAMPSWIARMGLGCDGRTLVVVAAAVAGIMVTVLSAGALALALLFVVIASAQFLSTLSRRPA